MAITFTRAAAVEEGTRPTSTQLKTLARAFNDRLRAFSFCGWRLIWYHFNLFRQMRNPSGLDFPAQGEFFYLWQALDPEHFTDQWPATGPGDPAGANLANPMNQFIFGIGDLAAEDVRLNFGLPFLVTPTPTTAELWALGKAQRGVYEPITGAQSTPAWDAAKAHFAFQQPWWTPHGKALGGWLPTPVELLPDCGATEATGLGVPSYELKWTSLGSDVSTAGLHGTITVDGDGNHVVTYAGTCGCGMDSVADGHVIGVAQTPYGWLVAVLTDAASCTYAIDTFPINDWIEGPYTGEGVLSHTDGNQLQRSLWAFHADFRGTPAQRTPDTFKIRQIAFDNQEFFTRQYALAPNKGRLSGDSIEDVYPQASFPASGFVPQGTFGTFSNGQGSSYAYQAGFVLAGVYGSATGLQGRCTIGFYSEAQLLTTLDLVPDDNGDASAMVWLKVASRPEPLKVKLLTDAVFAPGGSLLVEATEQIEYKPNYWDAYLLTRLGASQGGDAFQNGVDGRGKDTSTAKEIGAGYFSSGCINTFLGVRSIADWVNDNPVYDSMRRLSRDHCRVTRRQQFVSYEVTGGKTILRFRRFPQFPGVDGIEARADLFADIAPPLDALDSGALIEGETYIVRGSGQIVYRGSGHTENQTFTATAVKVFDTIGTASLYVYDGIRHTALKKGFTNEWTMFVEPRCYHPSPTSIWKAEAYSDYFTWCDRCHFYSGTAPSRLRRFITFNNTTTPLDSDFRPVLTPISLQAQLLSPEAPDQFRYAANANRTYGNSDFYKSCQVYNRPYEIESCIVDDWAEDQIIKITLTGRLRSHENAPATVAADPASWSAGDIEALANAGATPEDYRTDDNAVREYALSEADGNYQCVFRTGDAGTGSAVTGLLPDNPFGSCYPVFFFSKLIPEPYDDGNDSVQSHDSRCLIDQMLHMEIALRSMCEGFVDGRTSKDIICETGLGNLYDFTFENLCFEAFNGNWIGAFNLAARDDNPSGFGPLPNTVMYAEVFNRLVAAVNLLDKVRLDLPIQFSARAQDYRTDLPVTLTELQGTTCTLAGTYRAYRDHLSLHHAVDSTGTSGYVTWTTIGAVKSGQIVGCPTELASLRTDYEYLVEIDPAFVDAVPDDIQDLINNGNTGFLALQTTTHHTELRELTTPGNGDPCPTAPPQADLWSDGLGEQYTWTNVEDEVEECVLVTSGTLEAPPVRPSSYKFGARSGSVCGNLASSAKRLDLIAEQNAFIQVPLI